MGKRSTVGLRDMARSAAVWAGVVALVGAAVPPMVLASPLALVDPTRALSDRYLAALGRLIVRLNPAWHVDVEHRERLDHGGPFVLVVNHQSLADVLAVAFLRHRAKFLGKEAVFKVPVFGWALRIAGEVPVDRKSHESGHRALARLGEWLDRGVSVCVFPEGTRSVDGRLGAFKLGAFRLAVDRGRPIVPVVLDGAGDFLPKKSLVMAERASVRVRVLEPVETVGLTRADVPALAAAVRARMDEALAELERARAARGGRREPDGA